MITPHIDVRAALLRAVGPQGYEARKQVEPGAPLTLDLLLDGWLTVAHQDAELGESRATTSRVAPATLPEGRYRWEAVLIDDAGRPRSVAGAVVIGEPRPAEPGPSEPSRGGAAHGAGLLRPKSADISDFIWLKDDDNDGLSRIMFLSNDADGNRLERWDLANRDGDFQLEEWGPNIFQRTALFVLQDSVGEIGIGTTAPATKVHVAGSNPALRLDDVTGATGTWDMQNYGGDLRWLDQTTGRTIVQLDQGARSNALVVSPNGTVGLGTDKPLATLHVAAPFPSLVLDESTHLGAQFRLAVDTVGGDPLFTISDASGGALIELDGATDSLAVNGDIRVGSSRELKERIEPLSAVSAAATLAALEPVTYFYRADPRDRHVGFIAEDVPELVAAPGRRTLSPMDMVALVTRVVQEQREQLARQQATLSELRARLDALEGGSARGRAHDSPIPAPISARPPVEVCAPAPGLALSGLPVLGRFVAGLPETGEAP